MRKAQEEFIAKREKYMLGGGQKKIDEQHAKGKYTARERINMLFDPGTFEETGLFAKTRTPLFGMDKKELPDEGVITGFGKVNGRTVYAFSQDFTVMGGALGEMQGKKIAAIQRAAMDAGCPIVGLNDSGGARIQEAPDSIVFLNIFYYNSISSGYIPQVSAIMGPCAGGSAYSPALTDFVIMCDQTSHMYLTGPNVIKQVTGEAIDEETLGGARTHSRVSGVSHATALNDEDCIEQIKLYLSYMPDNCNAPLPVYDYDDDPERRVYELDDIIPEDPNKAYDCREIINLVFDENSFYEIHAEFAQNAVVGFARLMGSPVGVIANQPKALAGCIDINASDKIAHFVSLCDAFGIPLIYLADCPGYLPGTTQEFGGIIRHGAKPVHAAAVASVPRIMITTRKLYGGAAAPMNDYGMNADLIINWPFTETGVMGAAGAASIVFRKEIAAAEDPKAKRAEMIAEYESIYGNPYLKAGRMYTDIIIEPNETRRVLIHALDALKNKKVNFYPRRHTVMPV